MQTDYRARIFYSVTYLGQLGHFLLLFSHPTPHLIHQQILPSIFKIQSFSNPSIFKIHSNWHSFSPLSGLSLQFPNQKNQSFCPPLCIITDYSQHSSQTDFLKNKSDHVIPLFKSWCPSFHRITFFRMVFKATHVTTHPPNLCFPLAHFVSVTVASSEFSRTGKAF